MQTSSLCLLQNYEQQGKQKSLVWSTKGFDHTFRGDQGGMSHLFVLFPNLYFVKCPVCSMVVLTIFFLQYSVLVSLRKAIEVFNVLFLVISTLAFVQGVPLSIFICPWSSVARLPIWVLPLFFFCFIFSVSRLTFSLSPQILQGIIL